ncbi:MAG: AbrB/MazE/SpoVT family DNA-binding domain-containing protein [Candidatus Paceibacterota bacterium]|jgi:AbrB family looped-hinge helix DNA binding protein
MATRHKKEESLIGVTTVGEKGQIVIPADIREALKLSKGTKLMVIAHQGSVFLMRPAALESMAKHFSALQTLIKKSK